MVGGVFLLSLVICAAVSLPADNPEPDPLANLSGAEIAKLICQSCHVQPDPSVLDKRTWEKHTLPMMSVRLGIKQANYDAMPGGRILREEGVFPTLPVLNSNQWSKVCQYYISAAPEQPLPQDPRPEIQLDLDKTFTITPALFRKPTPMTTLVQILPGRNLIFVGDSLRRSLYMLDGKGREVSSFNFSNPPVGLNFRPEGFYLTLIGYVAPSDDPIGRVLFIGNTPDGFQPPVILLDHLPRPCDTQVADLNGDGREDLIVTQHGNVLGRFSWFEKLENGQYREHILRNDPGALYSYVADLNGDGLPDIVVLIAQAQETIFLYTNQGKGEFDERALVRQTSVWGSSYFELADFNGDGHPDLLVTNGDNAEYPSPMKKYHGVRIYLNDGGNQFNEAFFFPMNGAYKAVARDFDRDGKLDVAAISFFPDYLKSPEESFVYLHNEGNFKFSAHSFRGSTTGRWIVMDAADLDEDGRDDIVLGSFCRGPQTIPIPERLREQWQSGPNLLILRNTGSTVLRSNPGP